MKISSYQNRPYIKNNAQEHKTKFYNPDSTSFNGSKGKNLLKRFKNFFSMPDIDISFNQQDIKDLQEGINAQLYGKKRKRFILFVNFPKTYKTINPN